MIFTKYFPKLSIRIRLIELIKLHIYSEMKEEFPLDFE